jgi:hypothetical protein
MEKFVLGKERNLLLKILYHSIHRIEKNKWRFMDTVVNTFFNLFQHEQDLLKDFVDQFLSPFKNLNEKENTILLKGCFLSIPYLVNQEDELESLIQIIFSSGFSFHYLLNYSERFKEFNKEKKWEDYSSDEEEEVGKGEKEDLKKKSRILWNGTFMGLVCLDILIYSNLTLIQLPFTRMHTCFVYPNHTLNVYFNIQLSSLLGNSTCLIC